MDDFDVGLVSSIIPLSVAVMTLVYVITSVSIRTIKNYKKKLHLQRSQSPIYQILTIVNDAIKDPKNDWLFSYNGATSIVVMELAKVIDLPKTIFELTNKYKLITNIIITSVNYNCYDHLKICIKFGKYDEFGFYENHSSWQITIDNTFIYYKDKFITSRYTKSMFINLHRKARQRLKVRFRDGLNTTAYSALKAHNLVKE